MISLKVNEFLENYSKYIPWDTRIISIAGGSGSGKTYFSKKLSYKTHFKLIKLDDYIIPTKITPTSNWDLPECWDINLIEKNLKIFLKRYKFRKPIYDFKTGNNNKKITIYPYKPLILEGLYALHPQIKKYADLTIFIDISEKERLDRVLKRDIVERGTKTPEKIIKRWNETVQPAYLRFVEPQKYKADIVLI